MNTSKDTMVITQPCGCAVGVGSGALDFCGLHAQAEAMHEELSAFVELNPEVEARTWPSGAWLHWANARALLRAVGP